MSNEILNRQALQESNARSYPRKLQMALKTAQGVHVTTTDGRTLIDCLAGAGTLALGHNHPQINEAIQALLNSGIPLHTLDITTEVKDKFVQDLFESLPPSFAAQAKIQFCGPTGADAIEAALKLAKTATGRADVVAFQGAYHGQTHGALALMGNVETKQSVANLMPGVHFFPFPYAYRCPFGLGKAGTRAAEFYFERTLKDPESGIPKPAAVILEAIQGEGGVIEAPVSFLQTVRRVTQELGIPLILDEIQAGMGRSGHMWAFEDAGIEPDIIAISKAIGGGLPLAVIVYKNKLDVWAPGAHTGTFRGNQMAMATGSVVLEHIKQNGFLADIKQKGLMFKNWLFELSQLHSCLGDVRGRGLMLGVEIVDSRQPTDALGSYPAHPERAKAIQQHCLKNGLIVELGGRFGSTIRFLPPLIITSSELQNVFEIFHAAVAATGGSHDQ